MHLVAPSCSFLHLSTSFSFSFSLIFALPFQSFFTIHFRPCHTKYKNLQIKIIRKTRNKLKKHKLTCSWSIFWRQETTISGYQSGVQALVIWTCTIYHIPFFQSVLCLYSVNLKTDILSKQISSILWELLAMCVLLLTFTFLIRIYETVLINWFTLYFQFCYYNKNISFFL